MSFQIVSTSDSQVTSLYLSNLLFFQIMIYFLINDDLDHYLGLKGIFSEINLPPLNYI